ncbi:MAG: acyl carrier protein [Thermodesulfobacteriota bacterium]
MSDTIKSRVKKILSVNMLKDIDLRELGDGTPLLDYGVGTDSVSRLEFLVALEEEFGVRLDEGEITPDFFETVDSISDYISRRIP